MPSRVTGIIQIWDNDSSINPSKTISGDLSDPRSIFVTNNGDIYVDNGHTNGRVDKWIAENNTWMTVMSVQSACYGLFMDIYNNLYCSIFEHHQVIKKWLNDITNTTTIVAGTSAQGSASDMLHNPIGIFVTINLDLYVADYGNNRIQLFRSGQQNGTTVAGDGSSPATIELGHPTGIVLDGDQHLFIADQTNHRIIRSDKYGFYCILGCSSNHSPFNYPTTISFDSYGNLYVTDKDTHQIQKFVKNYFCGKTLFSFVCFLRHILSSKYNDICYHRKSNHGHFNNNDGIYYHRKSDHGYFNNNDNICYHRKSGHDYFKNNRSIDSRNINKRIYQCRK